MNICLASMIWFGRGWVLSFILLVSSRVPHLSGCVAVGTVAGRKGCLASWPEREHTREASEMAKVVLWFLVCLFVCGVLYGCWSRIVLFSWIYLGFTDRSILIGSCSWFWLTGWCVVPLLVLEVVSLVSLQYRRSVHPGTPSFSSRDGMRRTEGALLHRCGKQQPWSPFHSVTG